MSLAYFALWARVMIQFVLQKSLTWPTPDKRHRLGSGAADALQTNA